MSDISSQQPKKFSQTPHPGVVLLTDFILPLNLCQSELALRLDISQQELDAIVAGKRTIDPDLAFKLAIELGTKPDYWVQLEREYEQSRVG
ncbi:MAG: HigA family addiction module antitoxin [Anaerolineaceae bacterium]